MIEIRVTKSVQATTEEKEAVAAVGVDVANRTLTPLLPRLALMARLMLWEEAEEEEEEEEVVVVVVVGTAEEEGMEATAVAAMKGLLVAGVEADKEDLHRHRIGTDSLVDPRQDDHVRLQRVMTPLGALCKSIVGAR